MSHKNPMWKYSCIDAYEPLESVKGWKICKKCKEFPRVWIFNNGSHAKCCCTHKYEEGQARSESILSCVTRTGLTAEYTRDNLRLAWNKYVETGIHQINLPEGQW